MTTHVTTKKNRRKDPRVSADVEIKLAKILFNTDGSYHIGSTKNISCSGLYCSSNHFVNLLTKVEGVLKLPLADSAKFTNVSFKGIVVRSDPEKEVKNCKEYNIAIFFNTLSSKDKEKIKQYLNKFHQT